MNIKVTISADCTKVASVLDVHLDDVASRRVTAYELRKSIENYFHRFQGVRMKWSHTTMPTTDPHAGTPCPRIDPGEGSCTALHLREGDPS